MTDKTIPERQLVLFDLVILVLSLYVLISLAVDVFFHLPPQVSNILNILDNIICFVFLYDFLRDLYKAENKWKFLKWGWIDLLSSIPYLDFFRAGRLVRLFRLIRLIRAFRSSRMLLEFVFIKRTKGTFTTAAIIAMLMLLFSSIAILMVETDPGSNIKTAEDAVWWAFVTLTTTGYGDRYPVTTEGRMIAAVLMIAGVGLFGTFTGYIASWFVEGTNHRNEEQHETRTDAISEHISY